MTPVSPRPKASRDASERNGLQRLPWESALYHQVKGLQDEIDALKAANAELKATNTKLRQAVYVARQRLENWRLRQDAWRRERAELLERLKSKADV